MLWGFFVRRPFLSADRFDQRSLRDPVLTVREDEANGEIASLFADIRTHLETSSVNLVFRQFMDGSALVAPLAAGSLDPASHPDPPPPIETMAQFPDPADVALHVVDLAW